jgi:mRNA interferase HigB
VRIIARKTLVNYYEIPEHFDSKESLEVWFHEVKRESWRSPSDIKKKYRNASILKNNRVVFNICGNKYRIIVKIEFKTQIVFIRFVGTHKEYDKINAEEI